jgi:hypothetical protein
MSLNLQRIAWAVMLGAFFTFCGVCAVTVYGTYSFLFQSTVPMTAIAQASRGSIGITGTDLREDVERGERALGLTNLVRPNDQDSQGSIVIQDPYRDNAFVASVTLIGDSTALLRTALRPRFNWSNPFDRGGADYEIEFARLRGEFEVTIADDLPLDLALDLFTDPLTDPRVRVRLSEPGWYSIDARGDLVTVTSHGGTALIYGPDSNIGYSVTAGSGSVYAVEDDVIRARPQEVQLLQNSQLATQPDTGGTLRTLNWVCSSRADDPAQPRGIFSAEQLDGRQVLRITRSGTQSPSETGCRQGLVEGENWQDISSFESLKIRTSFYINFQSLPVCGFEGSECPLMIRLDYLVEGDQPGALIPGELIYGFYAVPGPSDPYDATCASCRQNHVRVQEKVWYSFDSGNILTLFTPDQRPVAISRLRFYASGHEYDVSISRMELIAENTAN